MRTPGDMGERSTRGRVHLRCGLLLFLGAAGLAASGCEPGGASSPASGGAPLGGAAGSPSSAGTGGGAVSASGGSSGACLAATEFSLPAPTSLSGPADDEIVLLPRDLPTLMGFDPNVLIKPVVHSDGSIYTSVNMDFPPLESGDPSPTFGLLKLTAQFEVDWAIPFLDGPDGSPVFSSGALGPNGEFAVTGFTVLPITATSSGSTEGTTRLYDAAGELVWSVDYPYGDDASGQEVAFAPDGSIIVLGWTTSLGETSSAGDTLYLIKYAPDGTEVWTRHHLCSGGGPSGMTIDSEGQIYVRVAGNDTFLLKFDEEGSFIYRTALNSPTTQDVHVRAGPLLLSADEKALYRVGSIDGDDHPLTIDKIDGATGKLLWTRWIEELTATLANDVTWAGRLLVPSGVQLTNDAIYVTSVISNTYSDVAGFGRFFPFVAKYDLEGNLKWFRQFGRTNAQGELDLSVQGTDAPTTFIDANGYLTVFVQRPVPDEDDLWYWQLDSNGELR